MFEKDNGCVKGIVLAGAHPWDSPEAFGGLIRPMLPVGQRPLVCHVLEWLRQGGITSSTICANGSSRMIRSRLRDGSRVGMALDYYDDPMPRGPAGCAKDAAANSDGDTFVVVEGTIVPQGDLQELLTIHERSGAGLTVVVGHTGDYGSPGECQLVPTGVYIIERRALDYVPHRGYQDMKEVLIPRLHKEGQRVLTHLSTRACPRVTSAATYLAVNEWALERLAQSGEAVPGYRSIGEAYVHETARIAPTASLVGPIMIGPNASIGAEATIVGPTMVGAHCVVEPSATVSRSVIWDACIIGSGGLVDQCVLVNGAEVQPGAYEHNAICHPVRHSSGAWGERRGSRDAGGPSRNTRAACVDNGSVSRADSSRASSSPRTLVASV
ncbi:MAG: NDP-sugar synthase [Phycisphaerae bacterium]|nr:NDP-sugar synthase [Phycisphaerae bacterium]